MGSIPPIFVPPSIPSLGLTLKHQLSFVQNASGERVISPRPGIVENPTISHTRPSRNHMNLKEQDCFHLAVSKIRICDATVPFPSNYQRSFKCKCPFATPAFAFPPHANTPSGSAVPKCWPVPSRECKPTRGRVRGTTLQLKPFHPQPLSIPMNQHGHRDHGHTDESQHRIPPPQP